MENFIKRNELGIPIEYYVVASIKRNNIEYILYTDLRNDKENELKMYCGKYQSNKVISIDKELEKAIIQEFINNEKEAYKAMEGKL